MSRRPYPAVLLMSEWAASSRTDPRWSDDAFLDGLRRQMDPQADAAVGELIATGETEAVSRLFRLTTSDASPVDANAPEVFRRFMSDTGRLPSWVNLQRVERGEEIYFNHALPLALVLLAKSLPEGYSAPALTRILNLSGDLEHHPFRRLLGVLQMVVNVSSRGGFTGQGSAVVTAQKLRLLHAGVRHIARQAMPAYEQQFGPPVNHEDMLATIMGFSYLVIVGLQELGVPIEHDEAEDLYYTWRVFAQLMGIHPPGAPDDASLIPDSIANAKAFYEAYARRHFSSAQDNPEGVMLAKHNQEMIRHLIPRWLRWLGFGKAPEVYMSQLLSPEALRRVGLAPLTGHRFTRWLILRLPVWTSQLTGRGPRHSADWLSEHLFLGMVVRAYGGEVEFLVPQSLTDLRKLA